MAFNYATGMYEPDQPQQVQQAQPNINDWMRLAGFGAGGANPNMNYASQAGGGGAGVPGQLNGGGIDTPPSTPTKGVDLGNQNNQAPAPNMPNYDNPYVNMGTVLTPQTEPANQAQQSPLQIFSQNAGNDPTKPPDNSGGWFWSNTAGHWVNTAGNMDSTGRVLSDAEKTYWQGYDHARASGTLETYLKTVTNPGLAAGTQAQYGPGIATTTIPGRTLDQTGAPGAANPAAAGANPAAAATQYNPLDPAWDYSKTQSVPWQAFVKNLFAEDNANQLGFSEIRGVLTPEQVNAATTQYGWQGVQNSLGPDANAVYRAAIQAAQADPGTDYAIIRTTNPQDGSLQYGIMKRSQSTATQEAGGFFAPGSTNPNSPANQARAALAARAKATSHGTGTGSGVQKADGLGTGMTDAQKAAYGLAGRTMVAGFGKALNQAQVAQGQRMGAQEQAKYNARYQGIGNQTAAAQAGAQAPGGMDKAQHDAQLAAQARLLALMGAGAGALNGAAPPPPYNLAGDLAGNYPGQKPGVATPAPSGNPPEGAIRVNPDDSRSRWTNGRWVQIPDSNR